MREIKLIALILIVIALTSFKPKPHKYYVGYKWVHGSNCNVPYSYHEEGGYLIDSTLVIGRGKDTIKLTIEDH